LNNGFVGVQFVVFSLNILLIVEGFVSEKEDIYKPFPYLEVVTIFE